MENRRSARPQHRTRGAHGPRARLPVHWVVLVVAALAVAMTVALGFWWAISRAPLASAPPRDGPAAHRSTAAHRSAAATAQPSPSADAVINTLTGRQLAGQRVIYSYPGLTPPPGLIAAIEHGEAAGVIFFADNIANRAQIRQVIRELRRADASRLNPVREPLLLMTDQEGGLVRRLPGLPYLSEQQIGQSADPAAQARAAGTGAAANLRGVGMNVNLAPVLDVYRSPGDFIDQFGRSYSSDPRVVSAFGADFITAQQRGGVAATAKHFPGLGAAATDQNTDNGPVTLYLSRRTIRGTDEMPYLAAISAGVKLVMVSWAVYPALDTRPAGLSPVIVGGELRGRLGFTGVTITDALAAKALASFGGTWHRSQLAAGAGMDLLLCASQDMGEGSKAAAALAGGYRDGRLSQAAFRASVARIIALRASLPG